MAKKGGLGSGLGALFGDSGAAPYGSEATLPISRVEPRSDQPRSRFDDAALEELTESIRQYGLIQPITVRKIDSGYYQIIAGERRWRAARAAGLSDLTDTIRRINRKMNPGLHIEGLVLTMYDQRTKLSTDVEAALRKHFPGLVYETTIPRNIRLSEAPSHGMPCLAYDKSSKGARAYLHLANEFLKAQKRGRD